MIYKLAVSFVLGIVFEKIFQLGWSTALLATLISIAISLFLFRSESQRRPFGTEAVQRASLAFFAVGLIFAIGILRMSFADVAPDPSLQKLLGQKISFEATVSDEPDIRDASARYIVKSINSKSFVLLVADRFPEFKYGDKIKISGKLELPKNFESENGTEFDYISYLAKDKIHFLIYRPQIDPASSSSTGLRGTRKIVFALYSIKNIFIEKIGAVVPEPNSSLLAGMIFGAKQTLGQDLLNDFKKAGLIHIVVLSGYNITIIAVGIFYLLSFFNRRKLSFILSAIFIVLFAVMVGWGATVMRAVVMALIAILAKFLGRPADALRWLFIAGLLMLLWNPLILFDDPSFQLSFMATLGLILFSPFIENFISQSRFRRLIPNKLKLREIVSSTLAVQFFVLPILIKMSGFVSVISFLVNPLLLPLVPWAMGAGALTGALGIIPLIGFIISWLFGVLAYLLTQVIIGVTEFSASLPLATFQTGTIPLWIIFIWYLGYGFLFWKLKTSPQPLS